MVTFRSFIAIDIEITNKINEIIKELKISGANLNIVEPEKMHITLKFLGNIEGKKVEKIKDIIKETIKNIHPFKVKLKDTGAFPNKNYMKVIWIGLKDYEKIVDIATKLDEKLSNIGFKKEKRKISPHITVARVKSGRNKDKLLQIVNKYKDTNFLDLEVKKIKLKKSELTKKGPIYTTLEEIELD